MRNPSPNRYADRIVFWVCCISTLALVTTTVWQHGYDTARNECKPLPSYEIKPMSHKQQVRAAKWHMRDKGWIR